MEDIKKQIEELENQIADLPAGTLVYKTINGVKQPYLQQTVNGKPLSKYVKKDGREKVLKEIKLRKELTLKLNELKKKCEYNPIIKNNTNYKTKVIVKDKLKSLVSFVSDYKKRNCYKSIEDYLYNKVFGKVFILYGLRRTGKTTLIKQAILNMNEYNFNKAAFIQVTSANTLADLNSDLKLLEEQNYKYVFIDEITLLTDFIEGAALLSDIYGAMGMKIVLSGTDSLGFWISLEDQLFDRTIMCHTTFISYNEFENVLGIKGIDNYICYGGTMSIEKVHYNDENMYKDERTIDEYIDSAIAKNIQHSLKCYQNEGHFRHLEELYQKNELTNVINRVVEDANHRFTIDVLTNDFISHDLGTSANNLRKDVNDPNSILDDIDIKTFTCNLKNSLDILNKQEQNVEIKEIHRVEIEEYLYALDLICDIKVHTIPSGDNKVVRVITQPGLRYAQAKLLVENLLLDKVFDALSVNKKKQLIDRILNEIKGRMMEEIVLLETYIAKKKRDVFKLLFNRGEYDMVVFDKENITCEIYEIKHSNKIIDEQYKNLIDKEKCEKIEHRYGTIKNKYVIYRGESKNIGNGIIYLNVEDYLKSL